MHGGSRGLVVGRSGVTLYSFDRGEFDRSWPWDAIVDVVPGGLVDARRGNTVPELKLHAADAGGAVEEVPIPVDALESHAWLVYTVLRFWKEHPELRDELDTSTLQDRMESWMAELSKAADAQRG
ncbi:MAG: Trk-type transport system, rane component [Microbacterium sp.]|nr:Trk-type transport system, rane component [Microbacterium sp.]